ncbi:MAG TPA: helix-turn-helix transcriptional regulator [Thermoanaerobaculia bacterium]|nr:helix-turn-helix transcriptional regulator [Thermoanaerobaculia bacterium]
MNGHGVGRRQRGRRQVQLPSGDPREKKALGRALTVLRVLKGLSQKEMAESAGLGQNLVSNWESGRTIPSFASVDAILRTLGFSLVTFERALQLVQDPMGPEPVPRVLSLALEPDLAELSEMVGEAVAQWYLRVMQRGVVFNDSGSPPSPREGEVPSGPDRTDAT